VFELPVGKARYGVMLREDGIVMDDGTTTRISENHYHMTTTTAQAANILSHLEYYLQVVWPKLNVNVVSTTEQWAGAAIAGPKSRDVLQKLFPDINVSNEVYLEIIFVIRLLILVLQSLHQPIVL
jgi:sarcosine oxidase subunit alpha